MSGALSLEQGRKGSLEVIPVPIHTLRIIVHPFFIDHDSHISYGQHEVARKKLRRGVLDTSVVSRMDDVTLIMPSFSLTDEGWIDRESWNRKREQEQQAVSAVPGMPTWRELVKDLKTQSYPFASNVSLTWNTVDTVMNPFDIEAKLKKKGFEIAPETEIILGGEWQEVCVGIVAEQLLGLPQVTRVTIDKKASLTSEYYGPQERIQPRKDTFYRSFSIPNGFFLTEDDRYIRIDRQ